MKRKHIKRKEKAGTAYEEDTIAGDAATTHAKGALWSHLADSTQQTGKHDRQANTIDRQTQETGKHDRQATQLIGDDEA